MAAPAFPPVPRSLFYPRRPKTRDNETALRLEALGASRHTTYAQHLWGFTILRTVYTPESDALFPIAMRRLDAWARYSPHQGRFPKYGQAYESKAVTDGEPNEELAKRFYCDMIEDKDRLAGIQSDAEGFAKLRDYFREWLVSVGVQPDLPLNHDDDDNDDDNDDDPDLGPALEPNESHDDPRFRSVLVVDEECLRSLIEELPDETPPLRTAVDREEWLKYLRMVREAARKPRGLWSLEWVPHNGSKLDKFRTFVQQSLAPIEMLGNIVAWATKAVSPPSDVIFAAIKYFIKTADTVSSDYDKITGFFDDLNSYLHRVKTLEHNNTPAIPELEVALTEVSRSVLVLYGIYTKYTRRKRIVKAFRNLVSGEDAELKSAYERFHKTAEREQGIVRYAILAGVEELKL
ncbi:uncharacterized protein B0H64DRAFT_374434 [Chaetomium fimeti]|uniref:Fungal STAND N-terminal Goodbye domain-containing protein n=1 Tax=Chaetomium fimeti TaxID=1854472 RepID=A0AAE0HH29_9PEZI|nr:hypothetical protein B0H64DRAFT_374434 [Chaetomium fimeti]